MNVSELCIRRPVAAGLMIDLVLAAVAAIYYYLDKAPERLRQRRTGGKQ